MFDRTMTPTSDVESDDSLSICQGSPMDEEKARAGHARWVVQLEQYPEFHILEALMRDPGVTPSDAVARLLELTRKSALEELVGDHCWHTACCFLEMVARTAPEQQSKLIAFLHCLRSVTLSDPTTNEPLRLDNSDGVVWRDLPTFGYTIADDLGSFDGTEQGYTEEEAQQWENRAAFFAQLDASVPEPSYLLDFSKSWALTACHWAFSGADSSREPSELAVRTACIWLVYDADKLWSKISDDQAVENTLEGWNSWKQGLIDSRLRFVNGTTPALIDHALVQMQRIDKVA